MSDKDKKVPVPKHVVEEHEAGELLPEDSVHDEVFTMAVERRMRTLIFVQELFKESLPDMTLDEASAMLDNPEFLASVIFMLSDLENSVFQKIDTVDAPDDVKEAAKAIFFDKKREVYEEE